MYWTEDFRAIANISFSSEEASFVKYICSHMPVMQLSHFDQFIILFIYLPEGALGL